MPFALNPNEDLDKDKFNRLMQQCFGENFSTTSVKEVNETSYAPDNVNNLKSKEKITFAWPKKLRTDDPYTSANSIVSNHPEPTFGILVSVKRTTKASLTSSERLLKKFNFLDTNVDPKKSSDLKSFAEFHNGIYVKVLGKVEETYSFLGRVPDMSIVHKPLKNQPDLNTIYNKLRLTKGLTGVWNEIDAKTVAEKTYLDVKKLHEDKQKISTEEEEVLYSMIDEIAQVEDNNFKRNISLAPYDFLRFTEIDQRIFTDDGAAPIKPKIIRNRDKKTQGIDIIPKVEFINWAAESGEPFPMKTAVEKPAGAKSSLFDKLKKLFDERPIWMNVNLCNSIGVVAQNRKIHRYLPYFAIRITSGAFSDCYIRFGYNPLKNKISRIYQIVRVGGIKRLVMEDYKRKHNKDLSIFGYKVCLKLCVQLCDLNDEKIRTVIKCQVQKGTKFSEKGRIGWLTKNTVSVIRNRLKELIHEHSLHNRAVKDNVPSWRDELWHVGIKLTSKQNPHEIVGLKVPESYKRSRAKLRHLTKADRKLGIRPHKRKSRTESDLEAALESWQNDEDPINTGNTLVVSKVARLSKKKLNDHYETQKNSGKRSLLAKNLTRGQKLWKNSANSMLGVKSRSTRLNLEKLLDNAGESDTEHVIKTPIALSTHGNPRGP